MAQSYTVKQRDKLLPFLFEALDGWSKKTVKQRLQGALVAVNGMVTTKHDFILHENDVVEVGVVQKKGSLPKAAENWRYSIRTKTLSLSTNLPDCFPWEQQKRTKNMPLPCFVPSLQEAKNVCSSGRFTD